MDLPVYFVSDIHLMLTESEKSRRRQDHFFRFLAKVNETGCTLFIVGDLFDFYFEYSHTIPKMYFDLYFQIQKLRDANIEVHYILGNHDYWVQNFMTEKLMTKVYFHDADFEIAGKKFHLTHGDGILSWDRGYRVLKAIIRNRVFISLYRCLHSTIGYTFAQWISNRGYRNGHSDEYNKRVQTELASYAESYIKQDTDYVISGHYHQRVEKEILDGKLLILGDWIHAPSYGYFDGSQLSLIPFDHDE
ncbi:MAG: UDP-2,3-diacylglucosamine diphosphatase [Candidatus Marinimicrobia bacterium]|nr:UDP-2,3-diacylglucosamine diphosphatase [Candidatus Neomarinimicrobiota bacterium]